MHETVQFKYIINLNICFKYSLFKLICLWNLESLIIRSKTPSILSVIKVPTILGNFAQFVIAICQKMCCFCIFLNLFFILEFKLIILSVQDSELMTCSALGGAAERGEAGGGWKSHLIANKSQNTLKNCCFSFTFQTYTDKAGARPSSKSRERSSSATQRETFRWDRSFNKPAASVKQ